MIQLANILFNEEEKMQMEDSTPIGELLNQQEAQRIIQYGEYELLRNSTYNNANELIECIISYNKYIELIYELHDSKSINLLIEWDKPLSELITYASEQYKLKINKGEKIDLITNKIKKFNSIDNILNKLIDVRTLVINENFEFNEEEQFIEWLITDGNDINSFDIDTFKLKSQFKVIEEARDNLLALYNEIINEINKAIKIKINEHYTWSKKKIANDDTQEAVEFNVTLNKSLTAIINDINKLLHHAMVVKIKWKTIIHMIIMYENIEKKKFTNEAANKYKECDIILKLISADKRNTMTNKLGALYEHGQEQAFIAANKSDELKQTDDNGNESRVELDLKYEWHRQLVTYVNLEDLLEEELTKLIVENTNNNNDD